MAEQRSTTPTASCPIQPGGVIGIPRILGATIVAQCSGSRFRSPGSSRLSTQEFSRPQSVVNWEGDTRFCIHITSGQSMVMDMVPGDGGSGSYSGVLSDGCFGALRRTLRPDGHNYPTAFTAHQCRFYTAVSRCTRIFFFSPSYFPCCHPLTYSPMSRALTFRNRYTPSVAHRVLEFTRATNPTGPFFRTEPPTPSAIGVLTRPAVKFSVTPFRCSPLRVWPTRSIVTAPSNVANDRR